MVVHPFDIIKYPDNRLREKTSELTRFEVSKRWTQDTIARMIVTMLSHGGVGLAAPQVGIDKKIILIDRRFSASNGGVLVMINPILTERSEEQYRMEEGCLSFPGQRFKVSRNQWVKANYMDIVGQNKQETFHGIEAQIVQHEIEHLHGVLLVDKGENSEY